MRTKFLWREIHLCRVRAVTDYKRTGSLREALWSCCRARSPGIVTAERIFAGLIPMIPGARRRPIDGRTESGLGGPEVSFLRGMATVSAGRRAKWLVLVGWLIIVAVAGPLSGKLMGAEKNDASAWLPAKAESTQVLNLRSQVVSPNVYPAVVVYDRPSGVTAADKAKAAADAARFGGVAGVVHGQIAGPFTSTDGKAIETIVPVNLGASGWNAA